MLTKKHIKATELIDQRYDNLVEQGFEFPESHKRRDPREPGRTQKHAFEDLLAKIIRKRFKSQKEDLREFFEKSLPANKAEDASSIDEALIDEETAAALLVLFIAMAEQSAEMFAATSAIPIAVESFNIIEIAQSQVAELITNIDDTTKKKVVEAVQAFADTPGMTVDALMDLLPFDTQRALKIATTEVTNLYAEMELAAAAELQAQFPDVEVISTWNTNDDPRVCGICVGLDGQTAKVGEQFFSDPEKCAGVGRCGDGNWYSRPGEPHPFDRCWLTTRTVI